jgi:hypothetical protein
VHALADEHETPASVPVAKPAGLGVVWMTHPVADAGDAAPSDAASTTSVTAKRLNRPATVSTKRLPSARATVAT